MALIQLTKAMISYFKGREIAAGSMGCACEVSSDWSVISLTMTLRSGTRYCCGALGCHIGLLFSEDYHRLREHLTATGFPVGKPMTLRVRWVVECGVLLTVNGRSGGNERVEHSSTCDCTFSEEDASQYDYFR